MQYFLIFGFYTSAMNVGGLMLWFGSPAFIQILNIFSVQLCSQPFVHTNNLHMSKASVHRSAHFFLAIVIHYYLLFSHL